MYLPGYARRDRLTAGSTASAAVVTRHLPLGGQCGLWRRAAANGVALVARLRWWDATDGRVRWFRLVRFQPGQCVPQLPLEHFGH